MAKVRLLDPKDSKRRLDRYELIGELASGGMATVFLGRLGGVGGFQRFVAIKRLHPHLASEEEFIEMFLDEARLAAGIHHPHVVPILEVGESDSGYYLVMEYIEGDTLARLMARALARAQPIPRQVLIRIVLDALAGLHAAHELIDGDGNPVHLVHRDVSPQNVLVGVDGSSRITDFGVAHAASRLQNTRADRLKGKLAYMSPEQARAGEVDRRADVFAMGIILWEVLAARRLFKGETEAVTLQRVTVEPIPRLSTVVPGIHPALDQVCSRALERDPNRRFRSAADMAEALERAARAAASASVTDLGVSSPREVAAYVQSALGEDIAAQRESVRAWLAHSEPSMPRLGGVKPAEGAKPPGYDVTVTMPLDRDAAAASGYLDKGGRLPLPPALTEPTPVPAPPARARTITFVEGAQARARQVTMQPEAPPLPAPPRYGSAPSIQVEAPLLTPDGASIHETPVEPALDDDDDHETLLMEREAAVELARRKPLPHVPPVAPQVTPPPPPAILPPPRVPAFAEDGTPSKSIESFMVPAPPPPSRTPQLVAIGVALLIGLTGLLLWWQLGTDTQPHEPATPGTTSPAPTVAATPPPVDTPKPPPPPPPPTVAATATTAPPASALPPAPSVDYLFPKLKGKVKSKATASPVQPARTAEAVPPPPPPPPDLPKPDEVNPYKVENK